MRILSKLITVILGIGVSLSIIFYLLIQWGFDQGLIHYINEQEKQRHQGIAEALSEYYDNHHGWQGLQRNRRLFDDIVSFNLAGSSAGRQLDRDPVYNGEGYKGEGYKGRTYDENGYKRKGPPHRPGEHFHGPNRHREYGPPSKRGDGIDGRRGRFPPPPSPPKFGLVDAEGNNIIGKLNKDDLKVPIILNEQTIGWLTRPPVRFPLEDVNVSLNDVIGEVLFVLFGALFFLIVVIGVPLAKHFVSPIKALAKSVNGLTKGDYSQTLQLKRKDEIGELARDIQLLTTTLENNEASRSRWIAGISHELRTPLAIALGEIEAMLEGVRALEDKNLYSVKQEIDHLKRLVNDLYELSNAEIGALRYDMKKVDLAFIMNNAVERFEELFAEKNFNIVVKIEPEKIWIKGDTHRLNQLFNNFFTNEYKYADHAARLNFSIYTERENVVCTIEDSGPGVTDEQLPNLFNYIYRTDDSRNRKTGGSGLGLSICEKIMEAHGGRLLSEHSPLGGLKIVAVFKKYSK